MLRFGTAGLRGPLRDGPDGMNVDTVSRASAGIAAWLRDRCLGGGLVIVGRDARHGSDEFATATAEVFAAAGFSVLPLPRPLPTPVVAFAVRELKAVAGVQITASHNPATDNGYKLYLDGGSQLVPPADAEIERCIDAVTTPIARTDPTSTAPKPSILGLPGDASIEDLGEEIVRRYLARITALPGLIGGETAERSDIRIALTAMHGVGGEVAVAALRGAGFGEVLVVSEQFAPDPDFPTVSFPNPEEPGASDLLLDLAERLDADVAVALDPDADRCAIGVRGPSGWRMLRGDETGVLLGDFVLRTAAPDALVATTIVSSRLLSKLAPARGARYAETLTGFKWLARAGAGLVYAYEEAIGHCVDPAAVRDKDGISAAVVAADLLAQLQARGRTVLDVLDDYAVEFGVHAGDQVSLRLPDVSEAAAVVARLRELPPTEIAGEAVSCTDMAQLRGQMRTDALVFEGATLRLVIRPSGTEPKLKCYLETFVPVADRAGLPGAKAAAAQRLSEIREFCVKL
ncbi:phospho-sugar mutase [Nocardia seriolae]|uniref:Phosphomannomutase n=1 Tax=Nocardia seriolae TaxID=37332 RepID=A0ABC8B4F3_9NOCA|nr:phospho-sugar mutase [Nocardia seriolae]APB01357.1 Phosphomannomutase [Nocardia seriolae]OJF78530.1 phosphomannomutase [Nocardia seriolae]PSK28082.1 phospho-sugar mutase [Nocardia seriolae]QOW31225.1 phospho-sugar mutase [Nocardia seriolae]QUN18840.1 phospho-sugar mutase [Nocardia seriolae]